MHIINIETRELEETSELIEVFSVTDDEGYPINYGHFQDETDALYVQDKINAGGIFGDHVSNLCLSMKSVVRV